MNLAKSKQVVELKEKYVKPKAKKIKLVMHINDSLIPAPILVVSIISQDCLHCEKIVRGNLMNLDVVL